MEGGAAYSKGFEALLRVLTPFHFRVDFHKTTVFFNGWSYLCPKIKGRERQIIVYSSRHPHPSSNVLRAHQCSIVSTHPILFFSNKQRIRFSNNHKFLIFSRKNLHYFVKICQRALTASLFMCFIISPFPPFSVSVLFTRVSVVLLLHKIPTTFYA